MRVTYGGHEYRVNPAAAEALFGAQAAYEGRIIEGARALLGDQWPVFRQHHTLGDLDRFVNMVRALQHKRGMR